MPSGIYTRKESQKKKISLALTGERNYFFGKRFVGKDNPNWKGGTSKIDKSCRTMPEYYQWRSKCFERDNWTCQTCHFKGYVTVHHIEGFAKIIKDNKVKSREEARKCLRLWDINNGVTLCEVCHKLTDNYKGRVKKYE